MPLICCFVSFPGLKGIPSRSVMSRGKPFVGRLAALGYDDALEFLSRSFRLSRVSSEI